MQDTMEFYLGKKEHNIIIDYEYMEEILTSTRHTKNVKYEMDTTFSGMLDNLKFKEQQYGYSVEGSIPKYLYGNNFETPTRTALIEFVDVVSERLRLPLHDARITRVDITDNIIMDNPPTVYMPYLGSCKHLERVEYEYNGIMYRNLSRHIKFYDKQIEAKVRRVPIPDKFKRKNVLRCEYAIWKNRSAHIGFPFCTISDLIDKDNYIRMIDTWYNQYQRVYKLSKNVSSLIPITNRKSFWENRKIRSFDGQSEADALLEVDYLLKTGSLTNRKQAYRLKNEIKKYYSHTVLTPDDKYLIHELNEKVRLKVEENKDTLCD